MASTGNVFPTVGATVDRAGSTAWTSPENVVSDNATDARAVTPTDYLVTSGYGFTIPANATIHGVTVRVEAGETGTGNSNYIPQLHSDTTPTLIGAAKSAVTVTGATKVISSNGGVADLWSATLTPAIVNAAGFGVSIWSTDTTNELFIDFVTIAIEFSIQSQSTRLTDLPIRKAKRSISLLTWVQEPAPLPPAAQVMVDQGSWLTDVPLKKAKRSIELLTWANSPPQPVPDVVVNRAPLRGVVPRSRRALHPSLEMPQQPMPESVLNPASAQLTDLPPKKAKRSVELLTQQWTPPDATSSDISAAGTLSITGAADLDAYGDLAVAGTLSITGAADLDAVGNLAVIGTLSISGAADLDAYGNLVSAGSLSLTGTADLDAYGNLAVIGTLSITGAADLDAYGDMAASGTLVINGSAELDGAAVVVDETGGATVPERRRRRLKTDDISLLIRDRILAEDELIMKVIKEFVEQRTIE